jgi:ABC-type multidrug transport system ATPase subunit
MSLLFSSHLLPDVEFVCEHVLVLGQGRLLAQGDVKTLKQVHRLCYEVRLKGDPEAFLLKLREAGGEARPDAQLDDLLLVQLPPEQSPNLLWQLAATQGEQIRYLRPQRSSLEEVFLQAIEHGDRK